MYDSAFNPATDITSDSVWSDWTNLSNRFSGIQNKIRERRRMYKLDWTPAEIGELQVQKRWRDYVIDPLPRSDIDFKADRLTGRPLMIKIPTEQLDIDTVDVLNQNDGFKGMPQNTDLMALTKKLRETAKEIAQKRADSIEKFLNGTLYINQLLRKEHLQLRWAMHFLVDGYAGYFCYYDETASSDEYPIVLRTLDPLTCVYSSGDQKREKFIIGRQGLVFDLKREFGATLFGGLNDNALVYVLDHWCRVKRKSSDERTGEDKYVPEVWHCTYLSSAGQSGDPYLSNTINPSGKFNPDPVGWALKPTKTDYFEIPGDMIEARTTALTEDPDEMVASDLDSAREIWQARNYFLTRTHRLAKLGSGADLVTKGISTELQQHLGKGEGVTASIPSDSNINPDQAAIWLRPPPSDPNLQMHDIALNQMLQQTLIPITSLGNRGGTVSGAQVDTLDQGAAVRLQTFVRAMNLLNTAWARSCMQIASVFFADGTKKIPIYGLDRNSNPFAGTISAADINGDYTVFVDVNPNTVMEELQQALTAIRLTSNDPSEAILSKQTIREQYLNTPYNWQEEQRIKREAEEFNENAIKVAAQRNIAQAQLQVVANLEQMRVQSILKGVPPNPILGQMMQALQDQLLKGVIADEAQAAKPQGNNMSPGGIALPTAEGTAPTETGLPDARTLPPSNPEQQGNQFQAQAARSGLTLPNGTYR